MKNFRKLKHLNPLELITAFIHIFRIYLQSFGFGDNMVRIPFACAHGIYVQLQDVDQRINTGKIKAANR